ncbi:hypothetical protein [Sulfurospirillum arcachonense]|uniref:hypothetical protein n=1 Tax=Sulfurospirillum arcachonense TaxID=57666 RepID=UPI000468DF02|nr:hypothetical protein [Sulfurospirillum arcachonense]
MNGTIIFYNLDNGSGLILSEDKKKYKFDIQMWDDFDYMPAIGLKVSFKINDETVTNINKYQDDIIVLEEPKQSSAPTSVEDAARMILQTGIFALSDEDTLDKLDVDSYSAKSVPNGFIEATMNKFFASLHETVDKYKDYQLQSDEEELDYFKMKRFLFTAYNNLLEIDISLADGSLTQTYRNIQDINSIHDIYKKSFIYPKIAFSTIFLKHTRYKEAKRRLEKNISEMASIKSNLSVMESDIKYKLEKLGQLDKDDERFMPLTKSIRHIKRIYVDAIDRVGTLREENEALVPITDEYFELFFEEFTKKFESSYEKNIKSLIGILDSMAFLFDRLMWEKASSSNIITKHFKDAGIDYPYSSLTFLRYYLKTLNKSKLTKENKELFDLLEYLEKRSKRDKK